MFCSLCISKTAIKNKQRRCPLCKSPYILLELNPYSLFSNSIMKLIQSLTLPCQFCSETGVKWLHQYSQLPLHMWKHYKNKFERCQYCNSNILSMVAEEHIKNYCPESKKICKLCKVEVPKKDLLRHVGEECSYAFTQCTICDFRYPKSDQ
jgi:hypothetical protein